MRKNYHLVLVKSVKSFRNEITPGNFIFRTREFEQMELEFFCKPGEEIEWQNYWKTFASQWLKDLNINEENMRLRIMMKKNYLTILMRLQILNINSIWLGRIMGYCKPY